MSFNFGYNPIPGNFPGVLSHQSIVRNQVSTLGVLDYWETANGGLPDNLICNTIKTTGQIQCGTTLNANEVNATIGFFPDLSGVNNINGLPYPPGAGNAQQIAITTTFGSTSVPATQTVTLATYTLPTPLSANTNYFISVPYNIATATQSPAMSGFNASIFAGNALGEALGACITSFNTGVQLNWAGTISGIINTGANPLPAITLYCINSDPTNNYTLAGTGGTLNMYVMEV